MNRPGGIQNVMGELKALKELRIQESFLSKDSTNPFICNVQYAFQDSVFLYLVLDLAEAGDLRVNMRMMPRYHFSEKVAKFFFAQLVMAVSYCHQNHLLHRDIKPENILIRSNGYLKLTDFGIAKRLTDIDECHSTSGTQGYQPPELYMNDHKHGRSADWFAVGVTLHEMVTGRRPFETSRLQQFSKITILTTEKLPLDYLFHHPDCAGISRSCKDLLSGFLDIRVIHFVNK
jgi:serine/threonine protein kinase